MATIKFPGLVFAALLLLPTLTVGCFGYEREWSTNPESILSSNRGRSRYVYQAILTDAARAPAPRPALPFMELAPAGLREIAIINARAEFFGSSGLVRSEGELYRDLSEVAQRLGATHFHVAKTAVTDSYITALVASALAPAGAPLLESPPPVARPQHKCVASSLPEWASASPEEKKALLAKCH
ncbi:MAG TPA: hypothetical protein VFH68_20665 [Polyangia bacterium]|nr:hypothetical protein [Polyangia bacterium]